MAAYKAALRTDDKIAIAYDMFLSRRTGASVAIEDLVLRDIVYKPSSFRAFQQHSMERLVMAYFANAREWYGRMIMQEPRALVTGDILYYDASRVSCKEVLLVNFGSYGKLCAAPLQVLGDSGAQLDPVAGIERVAIRMAGSLGPLPLADAPPADTLALADAPAADEPAAAAPPAAAPAGRARGKGTSRGKGRGKGKGRGRGRKPVSAPGDATAWLLLALIQSMLTIIPFSDLTPWLPSTINLENPTFQRLYDDFTKRYYVWHGTDHQGKAHWSLPPELQGPGRGGVRVLVMCADEGPTGFSLFQFLASYHKMRIFFIRDPNHRLSNAFNAGLRGNKDVIAATLDIITVHKWRRAPYGGGRFWNEAKEALTVLLSSAGENHDLFQAYAAAIANDHREAPELVVCDHGRLKDLMRTMLSLPMGQRVEMRRWFTYHNAGWTLDKVWHTMLEALLALFCIEGKDPWKAITDAPPVRPDAKNDNPEQKTFRYKVSVLRTLANSLNQKILRSSLVCSKRLYKHHAGHERDSSEPRVAFRYCFVWSSWEYWITRYVIPTFQDAFFNKENIDYVGLEHCWDCESPLIGSQSEGQSEQSRILFLHARQCFSMIQELLLYAFLWCAAGPWSFCRLLHPVEQERRRHMVVMREAWELYLHLRNSTVRQTRNYFKVGVESPPRPPSIPLPKVHGWVKLEFLIPPMKFEQ